MTQRLGAFRRHQGAFRAVSGVVMIVLAVALTFNLSDIIQRDIPNYTQAVGNSLEKGAAAAPQGGSGSVSLQDCQTAALYGGSGLEQCGPAPALQRHPAVAEHPRRQAGEPGLAQGQGRPRRLLGLLLHQLPARAPARRGLGQGLRLRRARGRRRAHPRVRLRARAVQRRRRRAPARPHLPRRARQLLRHLERLRQPVLARGVPDRRQRPDPARLHRGRRLPGEEQLIRQLLSAAHPGIALPRPTEVPDTTPNDPAQTPETYLGAEREQGFDGAPPTRPASSRRPPASPRTPSPFPAPGRSASSRSPRARAPGSRSPSTPPTSTSTSGAPAPSPSPLAAPARSSGSPARPTSTPSPPSSPHRTAP